MWHKRVIPGRVAAFFSNSYAIQVLITWRRRRKRMKIDENANVDGRLLSWLD